ncbi:hypothetical protein HMI55_004167 [Coelomomyces lativittatus]|nr:hypothetical protein HMI55_004167 [Coelomomyces lativittatus]
MNVLFSLWNIKKHMYFNNSGPLFRLVDRISTGYRAPSILNSSQLVLLSGPTLDGNTYSFTFSRPLQANGYNLTTSDQTFLYAIKYNSTTRDNAYSKHTTRGKFTYNVFTSFASDNPTNLISMDTAVVWHKYCMSFAWNFSAGFGILIARFTKSYLSKWWFRLHLVLFCVTLVLTLVGFIIMMLAHSTPHFISNHAIIGLTVVVGMVLQFMLGILINLMFQKHRRTTPLRDQVHWYFGYVLYLLAAANVMLGLSMTSETLIIFSAVVYGGFLLIFIIAQLKWGQTHDKVSLKGSQAVLCI